MDSMMGFHAAMSAVRHSALSALPDAPVVPPREPRRRAGDGVRLGGGVRRGVAQRLRRIADAVEPRPAPAVDCC